MNNLKITIILLIRGEYMNNNYYPNYQTQGGYPNQEFAPTVNNNIYQEQSYIENILRLNKGKLGKFYCTFPDSLCWLCCIPQ